MKRVNIYEISFFFKTVHKEFRNFFIDHSFRSLAKFYDSLYYIYKTSLGDYERRIVNVALFYQLFPRISHELSYRAPKIIKPVVYVLMFESFSVKQKM